MLALGTQPLTTTGLTFYPETGVAPSADDLLDETPVRLASDADLEKLASVGPDLIVALVLGIDEAMYDKPTQITPVLGRPADSVVYENARTAVAV